MSNIERRAFAVELRVVREADKKPVIRGHAAVFNALSEDLGGFREQIAPGAFREAVQVDDVRALFNHDANLVLGRNKAGTLRLSEDSTGLAIEIDPPDTQYARDLMVSMERGDITQMSFGFTTKKGGQRWQERDGDVPLRTLTDVSLFDVSPVTFPAYPQTDVALRSLNEFKVEHAPVKPTRFNVERGLALLEESCR
jgi:HK97 family phage prohead protease